MPQGKCITRQWVAIHRYNLHSLINYARCLQYHISRSEHIVVFKLLLATRSAVEITNY